MLDALYYNISSTQQSGPLGIIILILLTEK